MRGAFDGGVGKATSEPKGRSAGDAADDAARSKRRALSAFANTVLCASALYCLIIVGYVLLFSAADVFGSLKGFVFLWMPTAAARSTNCGWAPATAAPPTTHTARILAQTIGNLRQMIYNFTAQ